MNLFIKEDFISHAGLPLTWKVECDALTEKDYDCLLYTSPSPRDCKTSRMPSSA